MTHLLNKSNLFSRIFAVQLIAVLFAGNLFAQTFDCFTLRAPDKYLKGVKKIAVLDFEGGKGRALSDYMVAMLLEEDRGIHAVGGGLFKGAKEGKTWLQGVRTNVFDLVERSQLEAIMQEQQLSNSGVINEAQAAQIGKVLGIDAIITGSVSYTSVDEKKTEKYKDRNDKVYYKYCTIRKVTTKARMKIISVTTAQIMGVTDASFTYTDKKCDEERSGLASAGELADDCCKRIAWSLTDYFCPRFTQARYKFSKIRSKEFKQQGKEAASFIKKGNIDRAFAIYSAIVAKDPYYVEAVEAVGGLYDIAGNFEEAKKYRAMLEQFDPDKYSGNVAYIEKKIKMAEMLKELGITITPHEFKKSGGNALAEKITTSGKRADRIEVKKAPDSKSKTVAKVPGGMEFTVIEKKKGWYGIKLLDGSIGYVAEKQVK